MAAPPERRPIAGGPGRRLRPADSDYVTFGRPLIGEDSIAEVVDSLRSGWIGTGVKVDRLERALAASLDAAHVCCVSSATAGLALALRGLGVGPGDEVLLPTMTYVASAQAIEHAGATPVPVDSEPDTNLISLDLARQATTPRTRAIMVVHLAGRPVDLTEVRRLADAHGLLVVEDAAHAIGASLDQRPIGAWGNPAVFSFSAGKNITSIEGGAVATKDAGLAERIRQMARSGLDHGSWERSRAGGPQHYDAALPGFKFNMTDVQAAVALHQLPHLDGWIERRAELWDRYSRALTGLPIELPAAPTQRMRHARHLYQVALRDDAALDRDRLAAALHAAGIGSGIHYRALHLHSYFRTHYGLEAERFPVATAASERLLSLPLDQSLTDAEHARVVAAMHASLSADGC